MFTWQLKNKLLYFKIHSLHSLIRWVNFQAEFGPEKFSVLTECGSETSNLVLMKWNYCFVSGNVLVFSNSWLLNYRFSHFVCLGYEIPPTLTSLWRYLHAAYSEPAFVRTCPSDAEILLHWFEHIGESPTNIRKYQHLVLNEKMPHYSFSVPVYAKPVILE